MLQIDLEVLAFWFPLLGQTLLMIPALAGLRQNWRPQKASMALVGQVLFLLGFFLASTLPCVDEDCVQFRTSRTFAVIQAAHLALSYSLLILSIAFLRRIH